jgi:hypothetical protein
MQIFYGEPTFLSGLCPVLGIRQRRVLVCAGSRREHPEGIDAQSRSQRQVDQGENAKDDREHPAPGLARQQGISGEKDAADAGYEREQGHWPKAGKPHRAEGAPAEIEVRVAKVAAEETVKNQDAKQPREEAKSRIDEPKSTKNLDMERYPVIGKNHRCLRIHRPWLRLEECLSSAPRTKPRVSG